MLHDGKLPVRIWWSLAELADRELSGLPTTRQGIAALAKRQGWREPKREGRWWRKRAGRGGGVEYHFRMLPILARTKLALLVLHEAGPPTRPTEPAQTDDAWDWFAQQPAAVRAAAEARHLTLSAVDMLISSGARHVLAMQMVAHECGVSMSTLYEWEQRIVGVPVSDWLPHLAPRRVAGRRVR